MPHTVSGLPVIKTLSNWLNHLDFQAVLGSDPAECSQACRRLFSHSVPGCGAATQRNKSACSMSAYPLANIGKINL